MYMNISNWVPQSGWYNQSIIKIIAQRLMMSNHRKELYSSSNVRSCMSEDADEDAFRSLLPIGDWSVGMDLVGWFDVWIMDIAVHVDRFL